MMNGTSYNLSNILSGAARVRTGDLSAYIGVVIKYATAHPYHNLRHTLHVFRMCYSAALHYDLSPSDTRKILIAALFHDFNHRGIIDDDKLNIARAIKGLRQHLLEVDKPDQQAIELLIRATEYPCTRIRSRDSLLEQILTDADRSQIFIGDDVLEVAATIAQEKGVPTNVVLAEQGVLVSEAFVTLWAKQHFPPTVQKQVTRVSESLLTII